MKFIFFEHRNSAGIYRIVNLKNGRVYIGSTHRFKNRARSHENSLLANCHDNGFLQNDFNKCGEEHFVFEVVEVVAEKEERLKREQFFIDQHYDEQKNCYNLRKSVFDTCQGKRHLPPNPLTDKRFKSPTPEVKAKRIAGLIEACNTPEIVEAARERAYKKWENHSANLLVSNIETGETLTIEGSVREFCISRNLSYKAFNQMVRGKIKSSNGWFLGPPNQPPQFIERKGEKRKPLSEEHRLKIAGGKFQGVCLVNIKGEELVLKANVKDQCRELNLPYTTLLKVIKGSCKSVCGWKLKLNPQQLQERTQIAPGCFIAPENILDGSEWLGMI